MPNRLAGESSPYLLQHAHNPVDWLPWGEEAFAMARDSGRPVLLSIGYSACHWCHVMERESFEDPETARIMNEAFVPVKVDREERPDVDAVYMRAVQALTGRGGWPLTVLLTPEGVPWYGGTYFPPAPRYGMPSFRQVLQATRDAWENRREEVVRAARGLQEALARAGTPDGGVGSDAEVPGPELLAGALRDLEARFDPTHGGFGGAPKFPQAPVLELLLRLHRLPGAGSGGAMERALHMAHHTLTRMARGGMRDHLGGGFHRYSVDARWLVPHFEKMLYDNALLARVYLQAWQVTGDDELLGVATSTLEWMLEDMRDPAGGFYSARDADSEGEEGLFYVWTPGELEAVLGPGDAALFARAYDVTEPGNFEGRNILHLPHGVGTLAAREGIEPSALASRLAAARAALLSARRDREAPLRDEKVLAAWNGLAIRALAEAAGALDRDDWRDAAADGARFVLDRMRDSGRLLHTWSRGEAKIPAFLDDHAALGNALVTLWEVTLDHAWLPEIRWACGEVVERFQDPERGVLWDTADDAEELVVRPRELMDNATPSGTSLAVELLLRAGHLFGEDAWIAVARKALARVAPLAARHPEGFGRLLSQLAAWHRPPVEVALVGPRSDPAWAALHGTVLRRWLPERTLAGAGEAESPPVPVPLLEGRRPVDGKPTAFLCRNLACREPTTDPGTLERQLQEV